MARKLNKNKKSDFITVTAVVKSLFSYAEVRLWVTGSVRLKVCRIVSQTASIIAKDTGHMSAAPSIPTSP